MTWPVNSIPTNLNYDIRFKFFAFIVFYSSCVVFEILNKHLFAIFSPMIPSGDWWKYAFTEGVIKDCKSVLCIHGVILNSTLTYC